MSSALASFSKCRGQIRRPTVVVGRLETARKIKGRCDRHLSPSPSTQYSATTYYRKQKLRVQPLPLMTPHHTNLLVQQIRTPHPATLNWSFSLSSVCFLEIKKAEHSHTTCNSLILSHFLLISCSVPQMCSVPLNGGGDANDKWVSEK